MTNKLDYHEYDSLSLLVKREALDIMISYYRDFGWSVVRIDDDRRFFDLVHLTLARAHSIENKDKLQLLQIRLEGVINALGDAKRKKHRRTLLLSLLCALFSVLLASIAVFCLVLGRIAPALLIFLGVAATIVFFFFSVKRLFEWERAKYTTEYKAYTAKLISILERARRLVGDEG